MAASQKPIQPNLLTTDEMAFAFGEHRFRAIFEQAAVGVAQVAINGRWMEVNPRLCEFLGYTPEELRTCTFQDITHPDDLAQDLEYVQRMLAGEIMTYSMEKRYRRKNGTFVWANLSVSLVCEPSSEPLYFIVAVVDIDARKHAERLLRDALASLDMMINASRTGLWDWNLTSNRVRFSREWKSQLGYQEHEISDEYDEWKCRVHPDDLPLIIQRLRTHLADARTPYEAEYRMRHKDGSWRWIMARGEVTHNAVGQPIRMLGSHIDITDRKLAEQALAASECRFRSLVERTDVIVWEADPATMCFTYVSPQAARLGYPIEEWHTPGFWYKHIHPDDRDVTLAFCIEESKAGRSHHLKYRMLSADGKTVWINDVVNIEPALGGGNGSVLRGVLIDITESTEQAELRETARVQQVVSTIAAGVAHEFNSLLMAAALQLHHHAHACAKPEKLPMAKAQALIDQARFLAAAMLDLYSDDARHRNAPHSLYPWLPETVARLGVALPAGICVITEVEFDLPEVVGHPLALEQVLRNLLVNAANAMGETGEIRVRAASTSIEGRSMIEIRVSDNGPGVPAEDRAKLFDPGFSTSDRAYPSGLGLAIAARLRELFGGSIAYEPNTPRGSTFIVRLLVHEGVGP